MKEKPWTLALQQKTPQLDSIIDTFINLIDSIDQPQDVHKIKTTLFSIFLPKLLELQSLALESTNCDYELDFINKGIDAVNLPSILRSKSVTETVPTYFKEKEPPIISYTYTKTIASKIFNFSSTLSDFNYHQFHNNPSQCECKHLKPFISTIWPCNHW